MATQATSAPNLVGVSQVQRVRRKPEKALNCSVMFQTQSARSMWFVTEGVSLLLQTRAHVIQRRVAVASAIPEN